MMTITTGWRIEYTRNNYPQTFFAEVAGCENGADAEHLLFKMMEKRGITIRDILSTSRV